MQIARPLRSEPATAGFVYIVPPAVGSFGDEHELSTRRVLATLIAELLNRRFAGDRPEHEIDADAYYLPAETLTADEAARFGIGSEEDLFGGVVPYRFVGTKAISHGLVAEGATAPEGWQPKLTGLLGDAVLDGFTAFSREDARAAARAMLPRREVRLKLVSGVAGRGQFVARDVAEIDEWIDSQDSSEIARSGVAIEENLQAPTTYSVGQVRVGGITASYYGLQKITEDWAGVSTYGGSVLLVARGGFDALLDLDLSQPARCAVDQARRFDAAVAQAFPSFFASRRNYDVIQGFDRNGKLRSGVLEQSWRIGGASGAELAALRAFRRWRDRRTVKARTVEIYSLDADLPGGALPLFRGVDPNVGPLTKYALTEPA